MMDSQCVSLRNVLSEMKDTIILVEMLLKTCTRSANAFDHIKIWKLVEDKRESEAIS